MRIGEAAAAASVSTKTLRFYEAQGLLPTAERAPNGYRDYAEETVTRLEFIRRGRIAGLALAQVREILLLRDAGRVPCQDVRDLLSEKLADLGTQIAALTALRAAIAESYDAAAVGDPAHCDPELICSYL